MGGSFQIRNSLNDCRWVLHWRPPAGALVAPNHSKLPSLKKNWVRTKSITIKKGPSSPRLRSEIWNGGVGNKSGYQNKNAGGNKNITKTSARTHTAQSRFESNLNPYLKKIRLDFFESALWFDMPRPSPSFPIPHCSQPLGPVGWEQYTMSWSPSCSRFVNAPTRKIISLPNGSGIQISYRLLIP